MAKITIDGVEHEFDEGMNLFEAVKVANGEPLPHFCYHPGLSIAGVCRMCQVEIEGVPKLVIACNATVRDGMVVHTRNERVKSTVRNILNFHLLHHPVDCPVCDQAGECSLQDFYMDHGLYEAEIDHDEKIAKGKVKPIGELVMLDAERCVLCARCTRFTAEVTKTHEMGIFNRGNHAEIDVAPGMTLDNNYSLNTVDICPVGALTSRDFRFKKRVWWLETAESVCPGCATGCNMTVHHSDGEVLRLKPRENTEVNDYWMCDYGRLLYKQIATEARVVEPLIRRAGGLDTGSWDAAYAEIDSLADGKQLVFVGSPHATLEENFGLARLCEIAGGTMLGSRLSGAEMGEADEILLSADRTPNAEGARRLGLGDFDRAALEAAASAQSVLVVLDNDLLGHDADLTEVLGRFSAVVNLGSDRDATAEAAQVVLPTTKWAEKEGSFVSGKGRLQLLHAAVAAPAEARDALRVLAELAALAGSDVRWRDAESIRGELAATHGDFAALAEGIGPQGLALDASTEVTS